MKKLYYLACTVAIISNLLLFGYGLSKRAQSLEYYAYEKSRCLIVSARSLAVHDFEDSNRPDTISKKINLDGASIEYQVDRVNENEAFVRVKVLLGKKAYTREFLSGGAK